MGEARSSSARSTGYETKGTPKIGCNILARAEYMRVPLPAARIKQARPFFAFIWPRLTRILRGLVYHRAPKGAPGKASQRLPRSISVSSPLPSAFSAAVRRLDDRACLDCCRNPQTYEIAVYNPCPCRPTSW